MSITELRDQVFSYHYAVNFSEPDAGYVATCAEFPSVSWIEADEEWAIMGLLNLMAQTLREMASNGEAFPEPFPAGFHESFEF